ncbi:MAG: hypothetical protein ACI9J5_002722, partial [Paraglaciecola sp.]
AFFKKWHSFRKVDCDIYPQPLALQLQGGQV